jgi:hypothetical protein
MFVMIGQASFHQVATQFHPLFSNLFKSLFSKLTASRNNLLSLIPDFFISGGSDCTPVLIQASRIRGLRKAALSPRQKSSRSPQ